MEATQLGVSPLGLWMLAKWSLIELPLGLVIGIDVHYTVYSNHIWVSQSGWWLLYRGQNQRALMGPYYSGAGSLY